MNEIVIQKADNLVPVSWNGERVLTSSQLAEFFATSLDNVKHIFHRNRGRFIEGVHYFKLEGDELDNLRVTKSHLQISPKTRLLYLWTKQGVARHSKSISTEMAWKIFGVLESHYFNRFASDDEVTREDILSPANFARDNSSPAKFSPQEKLDALLKCAAATDNPKLRDSIIRKAVKFILS